MDAMVWLKAHRLWVGLGADVLTFAGGLLLARDAFTHLADLRSRQVETAFRKRFPRLGRAMQDPEEARAIGAGRWALRGLLLLGVGFLCEIATRFAE